MNPSSFLARVVIAQDVVGTRVLPSLFPVGGWAVGAALAAGRERATGGARGMGGSRSLRLAPLICYNNSCRKSMI